MKFVLKTLHKPLLCKLHTISQRSNRSWGWGIVYQNKTWKLNVDSLQLPDNYKARTIKPTMLCKTRPHSFIALHKIIIPWTNWDIIFFQHLLQLRMICAICKQTYFDLVWMQQMRQASKNGEEKTTVNWSRWSLWDTTTALHIFCSNLGQSTCNLICWAQWYFR